MTETPEQLAVRIYAELRRQSEHEDGALHWIADTADLTWVGVDGRIDLIALATEILKTC